MPMSDLRDLTDIITKHRDARGEEGSAKRYMEL